jgi:hypothetical protein
VERGGGLRPHLVIFGSSLQQLPPTPPILSGGGVHKCCQKRTLFCPFTDDLNIGDEKISYFCCLKDNLNVGVRNLFFVVFFRQTSTHQWKHKIRLQNWAADLDNWVVLIVRVGKGRGVRRVEDGKSMGVVGPSLVPARPMVVYWRSLKILIL